MCPGREENGHEDHQALGEMMGEHGMLSKLWVSHSLSSVNTGLDAVS